MVGNKAWCYQQWPTKRWTYPQISLVMVGTKCIFTNHDQPCGAKYTFSVGIGWSQKCDFGVRRHNCTNQYQRCGCNNPTSLLVLVGTQEWQYQPVPTVRRNQNSNLTVGDGWSKILNIPPSNPAVKVTGVMAICSLVMVGGVELLVDQL